MPEQRDYTVTMQRQVRASDQGGQLVDLYEIYYTGPNGISGSVRVPRATATPALVDATIRDALRNQLAISQLGAQPAG